MPSAVPLFTFALRHATRLPFGARPAFRAPLLVLCCFLGPVPHRTVPVPAVVVPQTYRLSMIRTPLLTLFYPPVLRVLLSRRLVPAPVSRRTRACLHPYTYTLHPHPHPHPGHPYRVSCTCTCTCMCSTYRTPSYPRAIHPFHPYINVRSTASHRAPRLSVLEMTRPLAARRSPVCSSRAL
ncbi:hypothetical protein OH76DRAFT_1113660 [Lentinus brumalis]|uniref:Uncharacterized protein n=1 Tax=Lentinus brumalis TaxID=2498619 RepID=A0A371CV08_9APHY|nr:hypothetical protein OH76DRAFT_1113660 [Polyporus brumalis]